jgi:small subunit ribosomal protein S17
MPDQQTIEQRAQERQERRAKNAKARRAYRAKQKEKRAGREHGPATTPPTETTAGRPKVRQGKVVSAKADKTIVVRVDVTRRHRMYKKIIRESTTLHAHDERNDANEGDLVRIIETRPMSKTKRWRLTEVLERSR